MSSLFAGPSRRTQGKSQESSSAQLFVQLKAVCVPLLAHARLGSPMSNLSTELKLLKDLHDVLTESQAAGTPLTARLIEYTFFPLSSIFRQNETADIPDQIIEHIFLNLELLCNDWWWTCKTPEWEQLVLLAASVLIPSSSPKARARDDHTKEAACRCLLQLLRRHDASEEAKMSSIIPFADARTRFDEFKDFAATPKFFPVLGQLVSSLLAASLSEHRPLQLVALHLCEMIINDYLDSTRSPTFLPGVTSSMCKLLSPRTRGSTHWVHSDIAVAALRVLKVVVVKSMDDETCIADGAIHAPLSDIVELSETAAKEDIPHTDTPDPSEPPGFRFVRTASWLKATSPQLHVAFNTLTHILNHPSPSVLLEFSQTCSAILAATPTTLPTTQPLLLSNLLTLSMSEYPQVSTPTRGVLSASLDPAIMHNLLSLTQSNLSSLPRILPTRSDAKVIHLSRQITAVCLLSRASSSTASSVRAAERIIYAIGILLGPLGGIERWGYSLLNTLEFAIPSVAPIPSTRLLEVGSADFVSMTPAFVLLELKQVESREAFGALEDMLRALSSAAGEKCLYSVEWFVDRGLAEPSASSVAALWIACRLLEGCGDVELGGTLSDPTAKQAKRLEKACRWAVRNLAERLSEVDDENEDQPRSTSQVTPDEHPRESSGQKDELVAIEYRKGVNQLTTILDSNARPSSGGMSVKAQRDLHVVLSLHLIAISSSILGSKFRSLLIHTLYPLLLSLVSPSSFISSTAQATLLTITNATAYTSPANLVLANFDYALNSASLHLTRHNLDVRATKVLVALVNLAGNEVVSRAGDVVEECFDRLDEYHGYNVVVEGLIEVLRGVVRVIQVDEETKNADVLDPTDPKGISARRRAEMETTRGATRVDRFVEWFKKRHDPDAMDRYELEEPIGPVPQKAWGKEEEDAHGSEKDDEQDERFDQDPAQPESTSTPMQALTTQIVSRSLFFLTHPSPLIRSRILSLLSYSIPVLRFAESGLLPSVHSAWPFIVNRLGDTEPYVVTEAVALVESLVLNVGDFMEQRLWEDIWPRFRTMLRRLEEADSQNALAHRRPRPRRGGAGVGVGVGVGTRTAYSVSHRTYRSLLGALTGVLRGMDVRDALAWEVAILCRRFLSSDAHEELQAKARGLYDALAEHNADLVWLVLSATVGVGAAAAADLSVNVNVDPSANHDGEEHDKDKMELDLPLFLKEDKWDIALNVDAIMTVI